MQFSRNMKRSTVTFASFLVMLLLTGCGAAFQGSGDDAQAGDAGEAGLAGAAGDSATGGTSQGGTAGTVTGGTAGEGGEPAAGSGGSAGSTAGSGGSSGSSGEPATGGTAGNGGAAPSCAPEDAIVFPGAFTWNGFEARSEGQGGTAYCAHSAGGVFALRNATVAFDTQTSTVTFMANVDGVAGIESGVCGDEAPCPSEFAFGSNFRAIFTYVPTSSGYVLTGGMGTPPQITNEHACWTEKEPGVFAPPSSESRFDFSDDFMALQEASSFVCP